MPASDTGQLQLQISASAELLIRNLKTADSAVAEFQRGTNTRLSAIDERFAALGGLKAKLAGLDSHIGIASIASAATGVTLIDLARRGLEYASSLQEVGQQLGVTSKDLQIYRYAASQVGIEQDEMDKGLAKLTQTMGKAERGAEGPAKAFAALGLSVASLKGKTAGDIIPRLADGLSKIADPAQRAALEVELFGKAGQKLDTLLAGGSGQINQLEAAAQSLGLVLSDEQIANADKTADKLNEVKQALEANIAKVVADNAGAIFQLADALERAGAAAARAFVQMSNGGNLSILNNPNLSRISARIVGNDPAKVRSQAFSDLLTTKEGRQQLFERNRKQRADLSAGRTGDLGANGGGVANNPASLEAERMRLRAERNTIVSAQRAGRAPAAPKPPPAEPPNGHLTRSSAPTARNGKSAEQVQREADSAAKKDRQDQRRSSDLLSRAEVDLSGANADASGDPDEKLRIERERVDLAKQGRDRDLEEQAADNKYIAANLDRLKSINAQAAELDKQRLTQQRAQDIDQAAYDRTRAGQDDQIALLQIQASLAVIASDRRVIERRILALRQKEEREALERVVNDKNNRFTPAEKQQAVDQLGRLPERQAAERGALAQEQQGPLGQYRDQLVKAVGDMDEALEGVAAHGLQSVADGLVGVLSGTESVAGAFRKMASSIVADLARIIVERAILSSLGGSFLGIKLAEGGPVIKRAAGGPVFGAGGPRDDRIPAMLSNGEYIVNAAAYARNPGLVEAINANRLPRFATGGPVTARLLPSLAGDGNGGGSGRPIQITLSVRKGEAFEAEVLNVSVPAAVQVLQANAPALMDAAATHTISKLRQPSL